MSVDLSYMGTKRKLARVVNQIVQGLPDGPMLDAFAGMCAVGQAVAPSRQIWTNDIQLFPAVVGEALFCSDSGPLPAQQIKIILEPEFRCNMEALGKRFSSYLKKEEKYLTTKELQDVIAGNTLLPYVGTDRGLEQERKRLQRRPRTFPYRLATVTYVGSFFGAKQCMEIDSLRYAIDVALSNGSLDFEQRNWLLIVLGRVLSRINNSTGQFAQYIKPNAENVQRIIEKRRRSVWDEFLLGLTAISPVGERNWRVNNRCFCSDALLLLETLRKYKNRPSIVYADPPYSTVQYSRYYHVLDVLVEYCYPPISGNGRYPNRRFQTPFAHSRAVAKSITELIEGVSKLGASLILSYPENGLFIRQGGNLVDVMKRHYEHVDIAHQEVQNHSTFGGPKAAPKVSVLENVFLGYC